MQKVVWVTGASSGVGLAVSEELAARGWRVYGTSRSGRAGGEGVVMLELDVTREESVTACLGEILAREGRLDALVNNAGMGIAGPLEETPEAMARDQLEVNLMGAWRAAKAVLPVFRKQGQGRILNISSLAAVIPIPYQAFYSAGKAALESLMEALEMEAEGWGLRVTCLELGDVKTGFTGARRFTPGLDEGPYALSARRSITKMERDEQSGMDPARVARTAAALLERKHPPHRAGCGLAAKAIGLLRRLLPSRLCHVIIRGMYT